NSGEQEPERCEVDGEEVDLLTAVVLAGVRFDLTLPVEVTEQLRSDPALLVLAEMHIAEPVEELEDRCDEERDAGIRMNHAGGVEAADEARHPAEQRGPDRHTGDHRDDEGDRHGPVNDPRGHTVTDDL